MPEQLCKIDIPEGWEFVRYGSPSLECVLDATGMVVHSTVSKYMCIIVRKAWVWPEWLMTESLFQTKEGEWYGTKHTPTLVRTVAGGRYPERFFDWIDRAGSHSIRQFATIGGTASE
jgi:hypothetical protein